jgi:hypothetical protein
MSDIVTLPEFDCAAVPLLAVGPPKPPLAESNSTIVGVEDATVVDPPDESAELIDSWMALPI